jgi:hypothetical protein
MSETVKNHNEHLTSGRLLARNTVWGGAPAIWAGQRPADAAEHAHVCRVTANFFSNLTGHERLIGRKRFMCNQS